MVTIWFRFIEHIIGGRQPVKVGTDNLTRGALQGELEEPGCRQIFYFGNGEGFKVTIRSEVYLSCSGKLFRQIEIKHLRRQLQIVLRLIGSIHRDYALVVVGILRVDRLAGFLGPKVACEPIHAQYSYDDKSVV